MEIYRKLANATACFHWIWLALTAISLPLVFVLNWWLIIWVFMLITTVVSQFLWLGCPLTLLENKLRAKYDPSTTYERPFISNYLYKRFGIEISITIIVVQLTVVAIITTVFLIYDY